MANKNYRNQSKRYKTHRRPFEKSTLDRESILAGRYGLGPKREILIHNQILNKLRLRARELLALHDDDPERVVYAPLLIRKVRIEIPSLVYFHMREVEVYDTNGVNVARGRFEPFVTQSSILQNNAAWGPNSTVDGNFNN